MVNGRRKKKQMMFLFCRPKQSSKAVSLGRPILKTSVERMDRLPSPVYLLPIEDGLT